MSENTLTYRQWMFWGGITLFSCITFIAGIYIYSSKPFYLQMNTGYDGKPVNNISVTSEGKVSVQPDIAIFRASYSTKMDSVEAVQNELKNKSNSITEGLKNMGVEEKDIKTVAYDIQPNYYYDYSTYNTVQDGHSGTLTLEVKVRKIEDTGKIIDGANQAGANEISSLYFTLDDLSVAKTDARAKATEAAKKKAEELASGSGVALGSLISISESEYTPQPYYYNMSKSYEDSVSGSSSTSVSTGMLEVTVNVSATYGIR